MAGTRKGGLKYWKVTHNGGDQFIVQSDVPSGANSLTEITTADCRKCWATSYQWCRKEQVIDLEQEGCGADVLDHLQPEIHISDWTAARGDCACVFELQVSILTKEENEPNPRQARNPAPRTPADPGRHFSWSHEEQQWAGRTWNQASHVFRDYGPGIRYILFRHGGRDRQFWAGHYGCKIAAPSVRLGFLTDCESSGQES